MHALAGSRAQVSLITEPDRHILPGAEPGSELQGYDFHLRRQHAVTVGGRITGPVAASSLSVMFVELVPLAVRPDKLTNSWSEIRKASLNCRMSYPGLIA